MGRLFGTDGVRGVAGRDLTARLAIDLSVAAVDVLAGSGRFAVSRLAGRRPVAIVGRDPRVSGEFLEAAVVAGLAGAGVDVLRPGVIPTPAVAYLTAALDADFGVMLSASHNPAPDNGIKFFARGGLKLPDEVEDEIEARLAQLSAAAGHEPGTIPPGGFGRVIDAPSVSERYIEHLLATLQRTEREDSAPNRAVAEEQTSGHPLPGMPLPGMPLPGHPSPGMPLPGAPLPVAPSSGAPSSARPAPAAAAPAWDAPLSGLRVVVDCAHGAAHHLAPLMLRRAGAEVIAIGAEPDGTNINSGCGSTSLDALSAAVRAHGADAGIAHDGDADRCLAVDAAGQVVDGDQILAVLALALRRSGQLAGDTVVTTVMSNLGFRVAMRDAGIQVVQTPVGDRYLVAAMREGKFVLGGEQSGHIILLRHATTGDGLLTALHLLAEVARSGKPLAELARVMTRYPQVLINIPGVDKSRVSRSEQLTAAVATAARELGESGRVLVRPSGTEPAIRVMVEAIDAGQAHRLAADLASVVRSLG